MKQLEKENFKKKENCVFGVFVKKKVFFVKIAFLEK